MILVSSNQTTGTKLQLQVLVPRCHVAAGCTGTGMCADLFVHIILPQETTVQFVLSVPARSEDSINILFPISFSCSPSLLYVNLLYGCRVMNLDVLATH